MTATNAKTQQFAAANPDVFNWIKVNDESGNAFAQSLHMQLKRKGTLSEKQVAAVQRIIATPVVSRAPETIINAGTIRAALHQASFFGNKRPGFRTQMFYFSLASAKSRNFGSAYVVDRESRTYLGRIDQQNEFLPSRDCTDAHLASLRRVVEDPMNAAIEFGRISGVCSCCNKTLTNALSLELGIGPECRKKYFLPEDATV